MGELSATHPISYDAGSWLRLTMERNDGQRSRTMNCFGATEKTSSKISVLLVDDHTMVRQGLRALLEAEEDLSVVGEAENGRQALQMVKRLQPDVVVMDIAMPALNGLEATRQVSRENPKSKVLILSSYSDDEYVQQLTD